ncbi:glycoside hydrolase family 55 protein [Pelomyxa schiedti]|nr:glycoside hydrolase family 55 protein [Pelomyxa schiedti]
MATNTSVTTAGVPDGGEIETTRDLGYNVVQWVSELRHQGRATGDEAEALDVAIDCLSNFFKVDLNDPEQKLRYGLQRISPTTRLVDVFIAGKKQLNEQIMEGKFQEYLTVLQAKDYFKGTTPDSKEYNERMQRAKTYFFSSFKCPSQPQPAPKPQVPSQSIPEPQETPTPQTPFPSVENQPVLQVPPPNEPTTEAIQPGEDANALAEKYKNQGNGKLLVSDYVAALDCYTKAININPLNAIYFANRAAAYTHLGQYENAVDDCNKAIALKPDYTKAYNRLGLAYFRLGKYREAVEEGYKKELALDPGNAEAINANIHRANALAPHQPQVTPTPASPSTNTASNSPPLPQGLESLMQNPMIQNFAQSLGGGGGGGSGNTGSLLNMAQNLVQQPGFQDMMNTPFFQNMVQQFTQNPSMLQNMLPAFMGGAQPPPQPDKTEDASKKS